MEEKINVQNIEQEKQNRKKYCAKYYLKSKERRIECACGGRFTLFNRTNHLRSKRHTQCIPNRAEIMKNILNKYNIESTDELIKDLLT